MDAADIRMLYDYNCMRVQERTSPTAPLVEDALPDLEAIHQRWREEEAAMRAFLATLARERLQEIVQYQNTRGAP